MLPSPSDLSYFITVAQTGNLTHAATRLGIAQPSLTLAMQRLEHACGAPLLVRTRLGVQLTKAGERIFADAQALIHRWEDLKSEAIATMAETRGRFRLGCHPSVARYALPLFLPQLLQAHPHLELALHHDLSRNITQAVVNLECDLGLVVNPTPHPDLVIKPLAKDVVTLWRHKRLKNDDVLIYEPGLMQTQAVLARLKKSGFTFQRRIESASLEVIAALAASGAGQAILPTRVAQAESRDLVSVKGAPTFNDEIALIYRMEHRGVRAIQSLSEAIQNAFAQS